MQNTESAHILLISKAGHSGAAALCQEIVHWLHTQGHRVTSIEAGYDDPAYALPVELAVVLGGDGTMLGVCRRMVGNRAPILGINFGRIGFLTEVQPGEWQSQITACLAGRQAPNGYPALWWRLVRAGSEHAKGTAVNDLVLGRGSLSRLIGLDVAVDGHWLGYLRCDGLILSTPLGSSGYCVSAGGALLCPGVAALSLTPICPFRKGISPMVFPDTAVFSMRMDSAGYITLDGQEGLALETGDVVEAGCLPDAIHIIRDEASFFERLRKKGLMLGETT
ncbi:MAG: NAD(+)/NADH kinase [Desulfovibrionaceae bacterium]|nr:NAD(+)/NADH kinase [Desulfovibrionaceae bacterium]